MLNVELPNELILIAASAIANPSCGKMQFSMLDSCEWQLLISLDSSVGEMAQDIYFIVRSRSGLPLTCVVANCYAFDPDVKEKPFTCLNDSVEEAIAHFKELERL